jgi:hypothetical protein
MAPKPGAKPIAKGLSASAVSHNRIYKFCLGDLEEIELLPPYQRDSFWSGRINFRDTSARHRLTCSHSLLTSCRQIYHEHASTLRHRDRAGGVSLLRPLHDEYMRRIELEAVCLKCTRYTDVSLQSGTKCDLMSTRRLFGLRKGSIRC